MKQHEIYEIISEKHNKGVPLTESELQIALSYWTPVEMKHMTWISLKARGCACLRSAKVSCESHNQHGQVSLPKVIAPSDEQLQAES